MERWRIRNLLSRDRKKSPDSPQVAIGTQPETSEIKGPASALVDELLRIQRNLVKTTVSGFGTGAVYYPQENGDFTPVEVIKIFNPFDSFANWEERGFSQQDLKSGLVQIKVGNPIKAHDAYLYESKNITIGKGVSDVLWMSGTGVVLRRSDTATGDEALEKDENPAPLYKDAVSRIQKLSRIPHEIKEQFGSYENFVRTYLRENGREDVTDNQIALGFLQNGVDFFTATNYLIPWKLFRTMGLNPLKQFVDALSLTSTELDAKIDSSNYSLRNSIDGNTHRVDPHIFPESPRASGM